MANWKSVAQLADVPPGTALEVVIEDRILALYNVEGEVYALDGVCSHQGGPLGKGSLEGCVVTCPWHGWQFDVRSGVHQVTPTIVQPKIPLRIESDWIQVDLETSP